MKKHPSTTASVVGESQAASTDSTIAEDAHGNDNYDLKVAVRLDEVK